MDYNNRSAISCLGIVLSNWIATEGEIISRPFAFIDYSND